MADPSRFMRPFHTSLLNQSCEIVSIGYRLARRDQASGDHRDDVQDAWEWMHEQPGASA